MYFNKLTYFPKHMMAATAILIAVAVNIVNLKNKDPSNVRNNSKMISLEWLCEICDYVHFCLTN
jgi:hypothetical protein